MRYINFNNVSNEMKEKKRFVRLFDCEFCSNFLNNFFLCAFFAIFNFFLYKSLKFNLCLSLSFFSSALWHMQKYGIFRSGSRLTPVWKKNLHDFFINKKKVGKFFATKKQAHKRFHRLWGQMIIAIQIWLILCFQHSFN